MDLMDNMRGIPVGGGAAPAIAPGTTAAVPRYSMGSTGSVTDNSLSGPTISQGGPFTMPGGEMQNNNPGMAGVSSRNPGAPQASNALSGGPSIPSFYGR